MARRACDGDGLLGAFRAAVANLEAHVDEINSLNVYPVPDGDTGSNMLATVKAALEEAEGAAGQPADRIAAAISFGALMGARGNSGVITSQIFRGMAEALGGKTRFNGLDLAHALSEGTKTAYGAVAKPVEGTILTVIRESAAAAVAAAEQDNDIEVVLTATLDAAEKSVARTPSLLAILREAGVVDSGGQGLYRLFQGALLHLVGKAPASVAREPEPRPARSRRRWSPTPTRASATRRCSCSRRSAPRRSTSIAIRDHLESIGESVLVAGDSRALKVHVHNERPDLVIGYGLTHGLDEPDQRREPGQPGAGRPRDESRGVHRREAPVDRECAAGSGAADEPVRRAPPTCLALAVVAVVAGDGLAAIFREFGVAAVVQGGQSANPSTGELLAAIGAVERPRDHAAAQQPERRPRRPPGGRDDRSAGRRRPDPQRRRRVRRAAGARPGARELRPTPRR